MAAAVGPRKLALHRLSLPVQGARRAMPVAELVAQSAALLATVAVQWHASSADPAPSGSWSTSSAAGGVALELKAGGGPANQAPSASAGPDLTVVLPNPAVLDGTVSDDGLPSGTPDPPL